MRMVPTELKRPARKDRSDGDVRHQRTQRLSSLATWVLLVLWAAALFAPTGPARPFIRETFERTRAAYLTRFRWEATVARGSTLPDGARGDLRLVMFTDYDCPFCLKAEHVVDSLRRRHPNVQVGYRHVSRRPASRLAIVAALCAETSGIPSAVHDSLYRFVASHSDSAFHTQLLDYIGETFPQEKTASLLACLKDRPANVQSRVRIDSVMASHLRVRGTPTFFGRRGTAAGVPTVGELEKIAGLAPQRVAAGR